MGFFEVSCDHLLPMAYIGPGAGFAFLGSFLVLVTAIVLVFLAVLSWPFRAAFSLVRGRFGNRRARTGVRRVVIVGLDGLDPERCRSLLDEGRLPHFGALAEEGVFCPLSTTCPPISPVAWSSFMTGVNPGKHNIFDFLNRDLRTYLPELSSTRIDARGGKGRPTIRLLRKSQPFWKVLGEYGVFSTILRVPITFPPEKFHGLCLSGMCVPDMRGTQGTFTYYSDQADDTEYTAGGQRIIVSFAGNRARTWLPGPPAPRDGSKEVRAPLTIDLLPGQDAAILRIGGRRIRLKVGTYSDWVRIGFRVGRVRKVSGICRFYLDCTEPHFNLYVTPVNIDPERPSMPISHPTHYSVYLAKLLGPFATLGLAEDTWARNEGVIDDQTFIEQVYSIHSEREKMFFEALKKTKKGLSVCVFDASDRIQHMFMRQAAAGEERDTCGQVIDDMYVRMDDLVGRVSKCIGKRDVLIVLSDHGFTDFRRGVNLNSWLRDEGYLVVDPDKEGADYLRSIDWGRTRAYSFGLSGIYINRKGREASGIVTEDELPALKQELISRLEVLADAEHGQRAVKGIYDSDAVYRGPYRNNGPDLVVGFERGYRASWDGAVGKVTRAVFSDNDKAWSGDHCVDQALVPGVFFCNRSIDSDGGIRLMDLGPTVLKLFGVPRPSYMDGKPVTLKM